jgi:6-phosphogluconolactonase
MAREAMIDHVPLPAGNVHPVPTAEAVDVASAAARYARVLEKFFAGQGAAPEEGKFPRFDLVLLGMGSDGHTASLFPGGPEVNESSNLTVPVNAPAGYATTERVSVTLPVLNSAAYVLFMATGAEKREVLKSVLDPQDPARVKYPSALVAPSDGRLLWYLDREAVPAGITAQG